MTLSQNNHNGSDNEGDMVITKRGWTVALLVLMVVLAACGGGEEEEGVQLQAAGGAIPPTDTPTPEPARDGAADDAGEADAILPDDLGGRLLVLRGGTFELHDLASGEVLVLEDVPRAFSPAVFNPDRTHAVYSVFPNFGVLDLQETTGFTVQNNASNPNGFSIAPDGQWLAAFTGQFTNRLQVLAVDGSVTHNVAASSEAAFGALWTPDSQLIWWENAAAEPLYQLFDPAVGESVPVEDPTLAVEPAAPLAPDGSQMVTVPVAFRPDDVNANPDACFDSYVELLDAPMTLERTQAGEGDMVWTERGLVASSPQWLDADRLLFVKLGNGECGDVQGDPARMVMLLDISDPAPEPEPVAGPLGNADDPNDPMQRFAKAYGHLYAPSPDGRYIAWIDGGLSARESTVKLTDITTGTTYTLLRATSDDAGDAARFIEDHVFRQVVWLE